MGRPNPVETAAFDGLQQLVVARVRDCGMEHLALDGEHFLQPLIAHSVIALLLERSPNPPAAGDRVAAVATVGDVLAGRLTLGGLQAQLAVARQAEQQPSPMRAPLLVRTTSGPRQ